MLPPSAVKTARLLKLIVEGAGKKAPSGRSWRRRRLKEPVVFKTNCSNRLRKHKEKIETRGRICRRFNCLRRRRAGNASPSQPRAAVSSLPYCEHSEVFCFCVAVEFDSERGSKKERHPYGMPFLFGDSWENRTPVSALRGPCLSRLTNEPSCDCPFILS